MRPISVLAITLAALVPSFQAYADWEYAQWGMTPEQVVRASKGTSKLLPRNEQRTTEATKTVHKVSGGWSEGALRLNLQFSFGAATDKLEMVGYQVADATQNDALLAWLTKKYGPPASKSALEAIGFSTYNWTKPDEIMLGITKGERAFVIQSQP